jgi:pimeloyl-ACP methyl ester carboxylesterase
MKKGETMNIVGLVLGWLWRILFGLLTLSMVLMGNRLRAIPLLAAALLVLPPVRALVEQLTGVTLSLPLVGLLVVVLLAAFVLLGSINRPTLRIMFAQFFPLSPIQESTFRWAFSDDPRLGEEFGEWFRLIMTGLNPAKVAPLPLKPDQRRRIRVPVLLVLGKRDNLVGDPAKATALVQDMPDIRVEVLDTGHLIGAEQPEQVNALILEFCG